MIDFPTDCIARKPFIREEAAIAAMSAVLTCDPNTLNALAQHFGTQTVHETAAKAAVSFADTLVQELYK